MATAQQATVASRAESAVLEPEEIRNRLSGMIDPSRVLTRAIERVAFASDASFYSLTPRAVVQPKTPDEIRRLYLFSHQHRIPLVFRAGGTSLSGQSITDGILVDIGRYWRSVRVEQNGRAIRVQPGLIGQQANNALRLYNKKIGPDPASIASCRLGGMLANNASGMCCGVAQNAYHTLQSLTFILPSGTQIDTADPNANNIFQILEPELSSALVDWKTEIEANGPLAARIRSKYRTKNTTGYALNAFLDFTRPVDIFAHLLVGSEGTLAFIAEAVLETVPDPPIKSTALLLFSDIHAACSAIGALSEAGAAALEIMDRAALASVEDQAGVPSYFRQLPKDAAGLLIEFQASSEAQRGQFERLANQAILGMSLLHPARFTTDPTEQAKLWKIRKGMFPSVGAVRASGTTAIIEDIAVPVERIADAAADLRSLFLKHGYANAILFGHAKDGNLHFVITQGFNTEPEIARYSRFMEDVVEMVVGRYDGALKAEHGTGRNMAPFVQTEWGPEAYRIMREIKSVVDPLNLLNPGVLINPDPEAHLRNLKQLPRIEPEVDKCIECGFCEHNCPSRDLTLTPRQRIVVRREMERLKDQIPKLPASTRAEKVFELEMLDRDFPYMALDTCAVDGLCATDCPVSIDTGKLTKRFRALRHSALANATASFVAHNFALAETAARLALSAGEGLEKRLGHRLLPSLTSSVSRLTRKILDTPLPQWIHPMPAPRRGPLPFRPRQDAQAVYFPSCISRILGTIPGEPDQTTTMQALLNLADRARVPLYLPENVSGHCCGVPFSSKGHEEANAIAVNRSIGSLFDWSNGGQLPIFMDTSPCTHGLKTCRSQLSTENQKKFDKLLLLDSVEFVHASLMPKLTVQRRYKSVALHPVCSSVKMGTGSRLVTIAEACSEEVVVPQEATCCAFAGDRGFLRPELTASATESEAAEILLQRHDGYYSTSRTCEIGMSRATGKAYRSYLHLLDWATRDFQGFR